jgi:hypothetical protein
MNDECEPDKPGPTCDAMGMRMMVPWPGDAPLLRCRSRRRLWQTPTFTYWFFVEELEWANKPCCCKHRGGGVHPINPTMVWPLQGACA